VDLDAPRFLTRNEFIDYVDAYQNASLRQQTRPPDGVVRRVSNACEVFTSPALRARESLKLLQPERKAIVDPVFAEEPLIVPNLAGRWPLLVWFIVTRGIGAVHPGQATVRQAYHLRAETAASSLVAATERGPVALIGHGWFNRAISKALVGRNWRRVASHDGFSAGARASRNWGHMIFESHAP
jgi:hypothetical protein